MLSDWFGNGVRLMVWREKGLTSSTKLKPLAMDPCWLEPSFQSAQNKCETVLVVEGSTSDHLSLFFFSFAFQSLE